MKAASDAVTMNKSRHHSGFLLLETMLGVVIFSLGVLAMAKCVNNCLSAEAIKAEDQRARLALENRMAEIEAGAVVVEEPKTEKLKGMFSGIVMKQSRQKSPLMIAKNQPLTGLYVITLDAVWQAPEGSMTKELVFYVFRPNQ